MASPVLIKLSGPAAGDKRERAGWGVVSMVGRVGRREMCLAAVPWGVRKGGGPPVADTKGSFCGSDPCFLEGCA